MAEQQTEEHTHAPVRRDPTTTVVAWVATIIATLALAGGIYLEKEREKLKDRINDVRIELRDATDALGRRDAEFATRDGLARVEGDTGRRLTEAERRYDELTAAIEYLRTQNEGARAAWVRAELEYVLRLAARHLEVERDIGTALVALRAVERRLNEVASPAYGPVLERVVADIATLERLPVPDVDGIVLRIDGMTNALAELPVMYPEGIRPTRARPAREPGFAGVDWSRMWRRIRESFRDMITIRREGRPERVLLSPNEEYFVRMSAQLKLESARVAAIRREGAVYRSSLRNAHGWVSDWYDTDDPTVQALLDEIRALERYELQPETPDLNAALRLLRAAGDRQGVR